MMKRNNGFTLIELLVAMAIASIVLAAVVTTYVLQVRSKNTQAVLTDMNQTARAALEIMNREIGFAGYDSMRTADAGIQVARSNQLDITMDINDPSQPASNFLSPDGDALDPNESVSYMINGNGHLGRSTGGVYQPLARNVDALDFVYLDAQGNVIAAPVAGAAALARIRSVQVTIVARAGEAGGDGFTGAYTDDEDYLNQQGDVILPAPNDNFRRVRFTTTIQTPNNGLI
jgi:type IV pilus assembly protein PilW